MKPKYNQQPDVYDTVFDFIFSAQEQRRNRAAPKYTRHDDPYVSALMEIGTQPSIYPITSAFRTMSEYFEGITEVNLGDNITAGVGSGSLANPSEYVKGEIGKARAKTTWASVGGFLHYSIDSALLSMYAKQLGASGKSAYDIGQLYQQVVKQQLAIKAKNQHLFGYQTPEELVKNDPFHSAVNMKLDLLKEQNPSLDTKEIQKKVYELQKERSKDNRIEAVKKLLASEGFQSDKQKEISESLWGTTSSNELGLYNDNSNHNSFVIAEKIMREKLANEIAKDMMAKGQTPDTSLIDKKITDLLSNVGNNSLGIRTRRTVLLANWLSRSGAWNKLLLSGHWERMGGGEDINFTQIVKLVKVTHNGEDIGVYQEGADSVIGQLLGKYYYLHPNNFINGIFGDGSLLLKWASKNGQLNPKSFAYLLYNLRIGKSLGGISKPFQMLSNNIIKLINPIFSSFKNFLKKSLTAMLGITGLGGVVINFIMNVVSDQLLAVLNQVVILVFVTLAGLIFLLFGGGTASNSNAEVEAVTDNVIIVDQTNIFTDNDIIAPQ